MSGASAIKLLDSLLMIGQNKLECLYVMALLEIIKLAWRKVAWNEHSSLICRSLRNKFWHKIQMRFDLLLVIGQNKLDCL